MNKAEIMSVAVARSISPTPHSTPILRPSMRGSSLRELRKLEWLLCRESPNRNMTRI